MPIYVLITPYAFKYLLPVLMILAVSLVSMLLVVEENCFNDMQCGVKCDGCCPITKFCFGEQIIYYFNIMHSQLDMFGLTWHLILGTPASILSYKKS